MRGNGSPQRSVTLPPLNLSRLESNISHRRNSNDIYNKQHDSETTIYFQRQAAITTAMKPSTSTASNNKARSDIIDASQTILFTSSTLQRTVGRCISYTGNDSLHASFSSTLYKSKTSTDKLVFILDSAGQLKIEDLIQSTSECIIILKELCFTLRTRLSILVQGLDAKFSRNLLVNLYTAAVDIKSAWETIQPYLTIDPLTAISKSPGNRNRSHSEASPILSPLASPNTAGDNTQLYTHLRNAVTGSLHVLNTLVQSIEETKSNKTTKISASLERKLNELTRQAQNAIDLCNRLDKNVEANMGNNKDDLLLLPTRQESSRRIWEDTSIYLKAIVSVMTFIRSISTEEDFAWPKSIKQGCLYVTRMTAEVAKLWNTYSTFAEDGFYLGRQERSASISEQQQQLCTSPAGTLLTPPTTDIPMQRRNTQHTELQWLLESILEQPKKSLIIEQKPAIARTPISIPFEPAVEEKPYITTVPEVKTIVYLNGEAIQLPEKPPPPENCCMSGCAHCVWDMYAEDMEDYAMKKSDIRNRFITQGAPLPKELEKGNRDDAMAEMDPTMKAFLDMEKKLKNM